MFLAPLLVFFVYLKYLGLKSSSQQLLEDGAIWMKEAQQRAKRKEGASEGWPPLIELLHMNYL